MAKNRVIGVNNALPWHLSDDLKRFKAMTMGHTIIMGRRTYESIGRPLPGRNTVVISRRPDLVIPGVTVVSSIADAINCANSMEVFIAGGAEIYREALPLVQRILLTEIQADFAGDTFFPVLGPSDWRETACENHKDGASGLAYHFVTLERRD